MFLVMYAVFDSASGVYDRPFCARSEGEAIRSFTDVACDCDHPIGRHPEHYSMFRVGSFDDNDGEIIPESAKCVARAHELVANSRNIVPGSLKEGNGTMVDNPGVE